MKRDLNNSYKQIFKDLYESVNGLYAFTFYSRYKMPPSVVFEFIEKYKMNNVLILKNGKISLTSNGRDLASHFIKNTKTKSKSKYSRIPSEFLDMKLKINSLYLPDIENI